MPTPKKAVTIDELTAQIDAANLVVFTDYRGLSVADLQALRRTLRPVQGEFRVAKNTLTRIAAGRLGVEGLESVLEGPLALGFANGDAVAFAKALSDYARISRILTIKGGLFEGQYLPADSIEALSQLPSKEQLQGKLLGLFQSPMTRTVAVLSGPSRSLAYVLQARADQLAPVEPAA